MSTAVEHGLVGLSQILRYKPAVKCVQKTDDQGIYRLLSCLFLCDFVLCSAGMAKEDSVKILLQRCDAISLYGGVVPLISAVTLLRGAKSCETVRSDVMMCSLQ
jgi:hypothetical protein